MEAQPTLSYTGLNCLQVSPPQCVVVRDWLTLFSAVRGGNRAMRVICQKERDATLLTRQCLLRAYNVLQAKSGLPELRPIECADCERVPLLLAFLKDRRPVEVPQMAYNVILMRFLNRPTIYSNWLKEAYLRLTFTPISEEAIQHAVYAIETESTWNDRLKTASPEQHLAKSDRLLSEQRNSNVVDVGVLIGYGLHLTYHISKGHWATNVSLIYSIMAMASAAGLHLPPSQSRISLWRSVPHEGHALLARLFWIFRSWQCQIHFSSVASWPILIVDEDIGLELHEPGDDSQTLAARLYVDVSRLLVDVHEQRMRSPNSLTLDNIKTQRTNLERVSLTIKAKLNDAPSISSQLALLVPLIFCQTGTLILLDLVQGKQRTWEMIELTDAISEICIDISDHALWVSSRVLAADLTIPDIDLYVAWCFFAVSQVVYNQIEYLEHVRFPLARELWSTIGATLRHILELLATEQHSAKLLGGMLDAARHSKAPSRSSMPDMQVSINELLLDVFAERLERAKRGLKFMEDPTDLLH